MLNPFCQQAEMHTHTHTDVRTKMISRNQVCAWFKISKTLVSKSLAGHALLRTYMQGLQHRSCAVKMITLLQAT